MNAARPPDNTALVTGVAGFVGFHLATLYRRRGYRVIGIDRPALPAINRARLDILRKKNIFVGLGNLAEENFAAEFMAQHRPGLVFHLAANANVRCSDATKFSENIAGMVNMLSAARKNPPKHFLYASSSSVYGENAPRPFCEDAELMQPASLYAKSKFAGEIIANIWAKGGHFPVTGLRFFNVYGPWGRPEMAPFQFADSLAFGKKTPVISGNTSRSWLYIDDAINACAALADIPPPLAEAARIVNIAGPRLVGTMHALEIISKLAGKTPNIENRPPAVREVSSNPANMELLKSLTGKTPQISFEEGIKRFLEWHRKEWLPFIRNNQTPMGGAPESVGVQKQYAA